MISSSQALNLTVLTFIMGYYIYNYTVTNQVCYLRLKICPIAIVYDAISLIFTYLNAHPWFLVINTIYTY